MGSGHRTTPFACWGFNDVGQTVPPEGRFVLVSVGEWHTCGITINGEPRCWGANADGQLQKPNEGLVDIASGDSHTCGLRSSDNTVVLLGCERLRTVRAALRAGSTN